MRPSDGIRHKPFIQTLLIVSIILPIITTIIGSQNRSMGNMHTLLLPFLLTPTASTSKYNLSLLYHILESNVCEQFRLLQGKTFLGVNCDSNDAKLVKLSSTISGGIRTYRCTCTNTLASGDSKMHCFIHYWVCPT